LAPCRRVAWQANGERCATCPTAQSWEAGKMAEGKSPTEAAGLVGGARRLRPGHTYFDLDHPENGPFVARGDEVIPATANVIAQEDVAPEAWAELVGDGFGEMESGAGDLAPDQGAFGQEDNPRLDVLNAAPPGVGEGLTPHESEEELPGH